MSEPKFEEIISDAIEWLTDIEKRLSETPLPDGSQRTAEQIALSSATILATAYSEWNSNFLDTRLRAIEDGLQSIYNAIPSQ